MRGWAVFAVLACVGCAGTQVKGGRLVPVAPEGATDEAARPRRFGLFLGVGQFDDSRFQPLRHSVADADAMADAIEGLDRRVVLTSPEQTNRSAVLEALRALLLEASNPQDTLILYFSTHGSLGQRPGEPLARYLVLRDTRMELVPDTGISVDAVVAAAEAARARRVLVVLATCYSGVGKSQLPDTLAQALARLKGPSALPPIASRSEAVIVVSAAAFHEPARESDELRHDVYTHFLLEALSKGDQDGDGAVTASEAHDYARDGTYRYTRGEQRPTSDSEILGRDPIVLKGVTERAGRPVVWSYAPSATGLVVTQDGARKGVLPGSITLEPGMHEIALQDERSGRLLYRGSLETSPGQRIEAAALIPAPKALAIGLEGEVQATLPSGGAATGLPVLYGGSASVGVHQWPVSSARVGLRYCLLGGAQPVRSFDEVLQAEVSMQRGGLWALRSFGVTSWLSLSPDAEVSAVFIHRLLRGATFVSRQSVMGAELVGGGRAEVQLAHEWRVELRLGASLLLARLQDGKSTHPGLVGTFGVWRQW